MEPTPPLTKARIDSAAKENAQDHESGPHAPQPQNQDAVITFRIGSFWLAVPAHSVEQIVDYHEPTPVPKAPEHVLGLIALRGRASAVIDLGIFLRLPSGPFVSGPETDSGSRPRVIIVSVDGMRVGIACHRVTGVVEMSAQRWREPNALQGQRLVEFSSAELDSAEGLTALLDLPAVVQAARIPPSR